MQIESFEGPAAEWDDFVRRQDGWTHFHLHGWRRVYERVFGHECRYLAARDADGRLAGVLPMVRVKSPIFGHFLVSQPFVNYGGPLGTVPGVQALAERATAMAKRDGADLLELRSRSEQELKLEASHRKITVVLDLLPDVEEQWMDFKSNVRRQVRRARKNDVEIRFGPDQLESFYDVYAEHMRDLGTPAQPRELFEEILREFPDDVWIACAYHEGRTAAGGFGLVWDAELELTWVSALREFHDYACNMLLYWSFMERCIEEGLERFNFGRCTPDSGTHRFKSQWGSRDETLWWYQWSDGEMEATPSPEDERYSWGPEIWKRIPLPVANALGPKIVQYIP